MSGGVVLSERARRAQDLVDDVLSSPESCTRIDALVRSAAASLRSDVASLSMLSDRQITLSTCHTTPSVIETADERGETLPFEDTICATALRLDEALVIPDTHDDTRVSTVPAVRDGDVGAYLGVLVRNAEHVVGVLCVAGAEPRQWTDHELSALTGIAGEISRELAVGAPARAV
ncbi:GAF domain-containing protein [uncultured Jatrophihabitans sp.]|uniref:GAF domain-containing protein n=1 Tax=uncultured Jatrophihabitans sp. TaxID=1610747 RepID=UPI0035CB5C9A